MKESFQKLILDPCENIWNREISGNKMKWLLVALLEQNEEGLWNKHL